MISMTSLSGGIHTISTNKREGNVHPLLREVNKTALEMQFASTPAFKIRVGSIPERK
ncbi:hypothetical protein RHMOL_Rhmol09G0077100 [Rhododendron molle]|uniref:Uncharacterized protein n=1 Tax=Rhododendron molle TaxID=49168 RepID=A0ACC0MC05_RHOML|nr:hypothetical protein RHMOL_Rhmol09G0077100 [Rhododendron molle]